MTLDASPIGAPRAFRAVTAPLTPCKLSACLVTENFEEAFLALVLQTVLLQLVLRIVDSVRCLAKAFKEVQIRSKLGFLAVLGGVCKG